MEKPERELKHIHNGTMLLDPAPALQVGNLGGNTCMYHEKKALLMPENAHMVRSENAGLARTRSHSQGSLENVGLTEEFVLYLTCNTS